MDQTKRPLLIPPEFAMYAEKHGLFDMYKVRNAFVCTCLLTHLTLPTSSEV